MMTSTDDIYVIGRKTLIGKEVIGESLDISDYNILIEDYEDYQFNTKEEAVKEVKNILKNEKKSSTYFVFKMVEEIKK